MPVASIDRYDILNHIDVPSTDAAAHMGKKTWYAVVRGRNPGLYTNWPDCFAQVNGFSGNLYQGFNSEREARRYLDQNDVPDETSGYFIADDHHDHHHNYYYDHHDYYYY